MIKGIYGNPYLSHIIQLFLGYCKYHSLKINEVVRDHIYHQKEAENIRSDILFSNNEFCKLIG